MITWRFSSTTPPGQPLNLNVFLRILLPFSENMILSVETAVLMKKKPMVIFYNLTMSRCSRFALFSSSSLTTSMWPSLAAEISAVQQSCTHRQPVNLGTPIRLQIQRDKRPSSPSSMWDAPGTVKAVYLPAGHTRCSFEPGVAWT